MLPKLVAISVFFVQLSFLQNDFSENFSFAPSQISINNKETIAKEIVNNLAKEDFDAVPADFSDEMKQQLTPEKIKGPWLGLISHFGAFKDIISVDAGKVQSFDQIVVHCQFENGKAYVQVIFSNAEKVIGLYLKPE